MKNQFAFIVITHERPEALNRCLISLQQIKINDPQNLIKVICIDNSVTHKIANSILFDQFNFQYVQQPGASQIDNVIKGLEIAREYPFFSIIHDDDILVQMNSDLAEFSRLKNDALYFFDSHIYNSNLVKVKKHKVNHEEISANRHLTNFFPHKMPLYPSYIYPNQIINFYHQFLVDKYNISRYGKYNDSAAMAALINKFSLNLRPLSCISYIYVTHSGQDSSVTKIRNKINLFVSFQRISSYQIHEYYLSLASLLSDILKSIIFSVFPRNCIK